MAARAAKRHDEVLQSCSAGFLVIIARLLLLLLLLFLCIGGYVNWVKLDVFGGLYVQKALNAINVSLKTLR
jgi:hypothetical protein